MLTTTEDQKRIPLSKEQEDKMVEQIESFLQGSSGHAYIEPSCYAIKEYINRWRTNKYELFSKFNFHPTNFNVVCEIGKEVYVEDVKEMENQVESYIDRYFSHNIKQSTKDFKDAGVINHACISFLTVNYGFYTSEFLNICKNEGDSPNKMSSLVRMLLYAGLTKPLEGKNLQELDKELEEKTALLAKQGRSLFEMKSITTLKIIDIITEKVNTSPKPTRRLSKLKPYLVEDAHGIIDELINAISYIKNIQCKNFLENSKAVVSIHPLDFLTMSFNDYDWRSCVEPTSENFCSTFSAMHDQDTMVGFLASTKSEISLNDNSFVWNNKKSRTLIHADIKHRVLGVNRTYPAKVSGLEEIYINCLGKNSGQELISLDKYCPSKKCIDVVSDSSLMENGFYLDEIETVYGTKEMFDIIKQHAVEFDRLQDEFNKQHPDVQQTQGFFTREMSEACINRRISFYPGLSIFCVECGNLTDHEVFCCNDPRHDHEDEDEDEGEKIRW